MQNSTGQRDRKWQWIIGFIVLVLLVWGVARLLRDEGEALSGRAVGIPVVAPDPVVPVDPLGPGDVATAVDTGDAIPVAAIVATPVAFHGRPVSGVAMVAADQPPGVSAQRGFWIEEAGARIFVVVAQSTVRGPQGGQTAAAPDSRASAVDVRPGQRIELSGRVYPGTMAPQVAKGVDAATLTALSAEPAFLLVEPANIAPAGSQDGGASRSSSPAPGGTAPDG